MSISLERLQLNANQKIIRTGLSATVGNVDDAAHFLTGTKKPCKIIQDKSMRNMMLKSNLSKAQFLKWLIQSFNISKKQR